MHQALTVMSRYHAVARAMHAHPFEVLATAAVRDAENGADFVAGLRERMPGVPIRILTGKEEAALSAAGVLCGIPSAEGILLDIGGGSLEAVRLLAGKQILSETMRLGVIRLADRAGATTCCARGPSSRRIPRWCPGCRRAPGRICIWWVAHSGRSPASTWPRPAIR